MNIRTKGANGEREVCMWLNRLVKDFYSQLGLLIPEAPVFQRNQNQSAVGGSDITNPFGLCIEVKRQEILALPQWWSQVTYASRVHGGIPILIYRQNGKRKWNIMKEGWLSPSYDADPVPVIVSEASFEIWFESFIKNELRGEDV